VTVLGTRRSIIFVFLHSAIIRIFNFFNIIILKNTTNKMSNAVWTDLFIGLYILLYFYYFISTSVVSDIYST